MSVSPAHVGDPGTHWPSGWGKFSKESRFCPLQFSSPHTTPSHKKELAFPVTGDSRAYGAV